MKTIQEINAEMKKWSEKIYRDEIWGEHGDYTPHNMRCIVTDLWHIKDIIENNTYDDAKKILMENVMKLRAMKEKCEKSIYAANLFNFCMSLERSIELHDWVLQFDSKYMYYTEKRNYDGY